MQTWLVLGNYIGCFVDYANRTLPYAHIERADITPIICVQHCINAGGYKYAGKALYGEACYFEDMITK